MYFKLSIFCIVIGAAKILNADDSVEADYSALRIIWGNKAKISEFPFFAALEDCGAAILNKCWLITTADCVKKYAFMDVDDLVDHEPSKFNPMVRRIKSLGHGGYPFWVGGSTKDKSHDHRFKKVIQHPDNDLALLKVHGKPLEFNKKVQPVKLPEHNFYQQCARFVGKGADESGRIWSHLRSMCIYAYPTQNSENIYGVACQYGKICYGDFGGPLVDSNNHLLGLARSNSNKDCYSSQGTYFVDISQNIKWIKHHIRDMHEDVDSSEENTTPKEVTDGSTKGNTTPNHDIISTTEKNTTPNQVSDISTKKNTTPYHDNGSTTEENTTSNQDTEGSNKENTTPKQVIYDSSKGNTTSKQVNDGSTEVNTTLKQVNDGSTIVNTTPNQGNNGSVYGKHYSKKEKRSSDVSGIATFAVESSSDVDVNESINYGSDGNGSPTNENDNPHNDDDVPYYDIESTIDWGENPNYYYDNNDYPDDDTKIPTNEDDDDDFDDDWYRISALYDDHQLDKAGVDFRNKNRRTKRSDDVIYSGHDDDDDALNFYDWMKRRVNEYLAEYGRPPIFHDM